MLISQVYALVLEGRFIEVRELLKNHSNYEGSSRNVRSYFCVCSVLVRAYARVCVLVRAYARVCVHVHAYAHVCVHVRTCVCLQCTYVQ